MPFFFDHYPYTNFHNINLDWVLQAVKTWGAMVEQNNIAFQNLAEANESFKTWCINTIGTYEESMQSAYDNFTANMNSQFAGQQDYINEYFNNLDVTAEINDKLDDMLSSGVLTPYFAPYIQTDVENWLANNITPTTPVIDSSLTIEGAGADAKVAGDKFKIIEQFDAFDVLQNFGDFRQRLSKGVTYNWNLNICTMIGTSTDVSIDNVYYDASNLPDEIELGHTYYIKTYSSYGTGIFIQFLIYRNTENITVNFYEDGVLKIPNDCIGLAIRVRCNSGIVTDGHYITFSILNNESYSDTTDNISLIKSSSDDLSRYFIKDDVNGSYGLHIYWDKYFYRFDGTTTAGSEYVLVNSRYAMPDFIKAGYSYNLKMNLPYMVRFVVVTFTNGLPTETIYSDDSIITIPETTEGIIIRFYVTSGITIDNKIGNVEFTQITNPVLMSDQISNTDITYKGVTYTWIDGVCTLNGTVNDSYSFNTLFEDRESLPYDIKPNNTYYIYFDTTSEYVGVEAVIFNDDSTYTQSPSWVSGGTFTVPRNAVGMILRLRCAPYKTFNGETISNIKIYGMRLAYSMPKLLVSFVDDDASATEYVTKYHDACMHNGIRGNYAVMPYRMENGRTDATNLLNYELEGFGILLHCFDQNQAFWRDPTFDYNLALEDLIRAIRSLNTYGFTNFMYWVYPSGYRWREVQELARNISAKCALATDNYDTNRKDNAERYFIRRCSFNPTDDNIQKSLDAIKHIVNNAVSNNEDCWLIITTHFNGWDELTYDNTLDSNGYPIGYSRFNTMVQYVLSHGFKCVSVPNGYSHFKPYLKD